MRRRRSERVSIRNLIAPQSTGLAAWRRTKWMITGIEIPASAAKLLDTMGVDESLRTYDAIGSHWSSPLAESGFRITAPTPLFPRLEFPEEDAA